MRGGVHVTTIKVTNCFYIGTRLGSDVERAYEVKTMPNIWEVTGQLPTYGQAGCGAIL
jgi:hypothetical protein